MQSVWVTTMQPVLGNDCSVSLGDDYAVILGDDCAVSLRLRLCSQSEESDGSAANLRMTSLLAAVEC